LCLLADENISYAVNLCRTRVASTGVKYRKLQAVTLSKKTNGGNNAAQVSSLIQKKKSEKKSDGRKKKKLDTEAAAL